MDDRFYIFATTAVILAYFLAQVLRAGSTRSPRSGCSSSATPRSTSSRRSRTASGPWPSGASDLVTAANFRAFWAVLWFLAVYYLGRRPAARPGAAAAPPRLVAGPGRRDQPAAGPLGTPVRGDHDQGGLAGPESMSAEENLFRSFPFVMMVAAILLIVTGRSSAAAAAASSRRACWSRWRMSRSGCSTASGRTRCIGVLATRVRVLHPRLRRPSWPVLFATSFAGALVVAIAIGWRNNPNYEMSMSGFTQYLAEFNPSKILESLNIEDGEDDAGGQDLRDQEYGGFLLMMDTVPEKAGYDYGSSYIRIVSTFIPRIVWPSKPFFGRDQWVAAWIAGSEMERDEEFTGPAIGILGATQLNGGAAGTLIVLGCVALLLRISYEYFRLHADVAWVQFWWAITFYNAWFMVVNDDPIVWFYYN